MNSVANALSDHGVKNLELRVKNKISFLAISDSEITFCFLAIVQKRSYKAKKIMRAKIYEMLTKSLNRTYGVTL